MSSVPVYGQDVGSPQPKCRRRNPHPSTWLRLILKPWIVPGTEPPFYPQTSLAIYYPG